MVEVIKITPTSIKLEGISFRDGEKVEKIMEICHKYKHMYKDGYPCGRKARKESGIVYKKWGKCPKICFAYLITNDNRSHNLEIDIVVHDVESLLKRYTLKEVEHFTQLYAQDVADEIMATI